MATQRRIRLEVCGHEYVDNGQASALKTLLDGAGFKLMTAGQTYTCNGSAATSKLGVACNNVARKVQAITIEGS